MREYAESDAVDFAIVGTRAGGGTLACRLAEAGFSVVAFYVGPWWRPLEEFDSDAILGPKRPRYPYRPHELNASAQVLAQGAERMGIGWAPTPLATVSAPRGRSPPCVYRSFCASGCATNAKQSALITWIPRAVKAGAEIRDLAMVGRIETSANSGLVTGVHYCGEGSWRFRRRKNVVVAGYAIETSRLLLNSADQRYPDGLANSSGLIGKNLTRPSRNQTG
jgi:choline dehydrogenase-like flavoprotein